MNQINCLCKIGSNKIEIIVFSVQSDLSVPDVSKWNIHVVFYFAKGSFG